MPVLYRVHYAVCCADVIRPAQPTAIQTGAQQRLILVINLLIPYRKLLNLRVTSENWRELCHGLLHDTITIYIYIGVYGSVINLIRLFNVAHADGCKLLTTTCMRRNIPKSHLHLSVLTAVFQVNLG